MTKRGVLVIGLDGACWGLIEPWIDEGKLPNIKKLREEGCWGPLESCLPPITCPNWQCYATGKNPGKLGVFWWEKLDLERRKVVIPSAVSFKSKRIWDYLNQAGLRTGVIGMPTTYPPQKIEGFMIAGGPGCAETRYTYPVELEGLLADEFGYKTQPVLQVTNHIKQKAAIEEVFQLIKKNFEIAVELIKRQPVDFLHITTFHINGPLQHYFYNSKPTEEAWICLDAKIGEVMPYFENVLIMSDHGTSRMIKNSYINVWLEREGYLVTRRNKYQLLFRLGFNRKQLARIIDVLHIRGMARRFGIGRGFFSRIPDSEGMPGGGGVFAHIDLNRTRAIGSPQGPLYINRKVVSDNDYEQLRTELIQKLEQCKDPETGKDIFHRVYRREDIYHGEYLDQAPDLIVLDADEYHNRGGVGKKEFLAKSEWQGNNSRYGLFLFAGPGIKKNQYMEKVQIIDLAPTIMHLMGVAVPEDMDGRVVREVFEPGWSPEQRQIIGKDSLIQTEKERVKKVIRKLGL